MLHDTRNNNALTVTNPHQRLLQLHHLGSYQVVLEIRLKHLLLR